jgi:TatD DNase family protein
MLIDAHAHIDKYGNELNVALEEIRQHRIFTVATAMDLVSYTNLLSVAERCNLILATFGVHPRRARDYADRLRELNAHIEASPAIGEIGLDFHWVKDSSEYPTQVKVLEYFLAAAREQQKLVNLHTKGAERKILDLLERYDIQRAIIHWYSGPLDILRAMAEFGAHFTVGVEVLYSDAIRAIAREIPHHLLLTETDNPGGLKWLKGAVGMPKDIERVVNALAELRSSSPELIRHTIHKNFLRMIKDDPWLGAVRALLSQPEHFN